ncbi:MAG: tRNA preQ1(34) S-adenosylmethionine ribosyltransferase-isomerase QueA [Gammaproteobacteria bacterium]|jgi:S-adenosylmethionine:tRNA ribosyltransferase-isomerase|nr:tRNA preQ1(34) S-adenosylmethionine ribosyltransferase-isomerase QueA [Chromatiales bacterium]MCP4926967.1 tRNA preQ1(34) S-adenosylmethionine ribosyltransferase-isomerase QueA [Gammaproteobacteria bacterium]MDP6151387.1 tRNA preQ1(34) S-adenosylmethionine ribosyltransferase-isomerase QueA [Gammaproteobacteria bacterium]MDP7153381.1 tRNA preQ1(34) S-adenosylmethionine ribosyltransferase-isomerase QueA [Gammaproteobacteria bacterium]MDP7296786.1 tRNA preQ1(34) S-adenosylmethionine ribosyltran
MDPAAFHFDLPSRQIAQQPLADRSASRLLRVPQDDRPCEDLLICDLDRLLKPGDLLILNDTKVIPARLFGHKASGGRVEMLLERRLEAELALVQLRSNRAPGVGGQIRFEGGAVAIVEERRGGFFVLRFSCPINKLLDEYGHMPLPPYIERSDNELDRVRYQTVFARESGAVAAPTAGLHFTTGQLLELRDRGIELGFLTLHVGAGTFQPLRPEQIESGELHAERVEVSIDLCHAVAAARARGGRVIAVGTTVVRALETAARNGSLVPYSGDTKLFIRPGFEFNVVDALVTNFHLPESSLLMLVCAFAGTRSILAAYEHAVARGYRFFSYGDAMFCLRCRAASVAHERLS